MSPVKASKATWKGTPMSVFEYYLHDLGVELKKSAIEVRSLRDSSTQQDRDFLDGKMLAYFEVLSRMVGQAKAFNIDPAKLGLEGFDPDKELL